MKEGKNKKTMVSNEDAVSPVIGVILMVAITVILAAVIAAFVFSMGPPKQAPQASLRAISLNLTDPTSVKIEHQGGADIILSDAKLIIEQSESRYTYPVLGNTTERYTAGDKLVVSPGNNSVTLNSFDTNRASSPVGTEYNIQPGIEVTVTMIDISSGQQIGQMRIKA